jgi:hypothetical protein
MGRNFVPGKEEFVVKDSGDRMQFASGMIRDTATDKLNYMLAFDGPMFERWVEHLNKGAKKYAPRNWMKAESVDEMDRAYESLARHYFQYINGDRTEDHAAAIFFNLNLIEYIRGKIGRCSVDQSRYADEEGLTLTSVIEDALSAPPCYYDKAEHGTECHREGCSVYPCVELPKQCPVCGGNNNHGH